MLGWPQHPDGLGEPCKEVDLCQEQVNARSWPHGGRIYTLPSGQQCGDNRDVGHIDGIDDGGSGGGGDLDEGMTIKCLVD